jgi:8-oxo-dGTP pyrophosphatase MutT (NUDIX family)
MSKGKVRPLAICVFRHLSESGQVRILASEGENDGVFYRPLGGKIEFGETGAQTVVRELREEIDAEVLDVRYLGTLENIFVYRGKPGHEIVRVYDGRFADASLYQHDPIYGIESNKKPLVARWLTLDDCRAADAPPLYPDGLLELLEQEETR